MAWIQITFSTQPVLAEKISELLHDAGADAVTLKEGGLDEIYEPEIGQTPLWQDTKVVGLFDEQYAIDKLVEYVDKAIGDEKLPQYDVAEVKDQDWERAWLADFKPMQFGDRLWIVPSEYKPPSPEAVNIFLDPGLAFGTGTHATTALCLQWLDKHLVTDLSVIDYGCGSGILAIAAAKLGAKTIDAVDIDPQALIATKDNAVKNSVDQQIKVYLPDDFNEKAADLLLANILANPLIELVEHFYSLVNDNAEIVLSGILQDQAGEVISTYERYFNMSAPVIQDGWVMLHGTKRLNITD